MNENERQGYVQEHKETEHKERKLNTEPYSQYYILDYRSARASECEGEL